MIAISPPRESDERFIVSTFLDSYRRSYHAGVIPRSSWSKTMTPVAKKLFLYGDATTLVARAEGETNTDVDIYGWASVNGNLVLYCYVKALYRRMGVAKRLLTRLGVNMADQFIYSCSTKDGRSVLAAGKIPNAKFDPTEIRK